MAQRTLGALTTEALHDDFDATKYAATAEQAIKDGIVDMARRMRMPAIESVATVSTVAGTRSYTLPTDLVQIVDVSRPDSSLAWSEDVHAFLGSTSTSRGTPTAYGIYGTSLVLDPIPTSVESLRVAYLSEGAVPSGSADTVTAIEDSDQWLLVAFARSRLFAKEDDAQMSDWWRSKYEEGLRLAKSTVQRRVNNANRRIAGPYARSSSFPRFQTP